MGPLIRRKGRSTKPIVYHFSTSAIFIAYFSGHLFESHYRRSFWDFDTFNPSGSVDYVIIDHVIIAL